MKPKVNFQHVIARPGGGILRGDSHCLALAKNALLCCPWAPPREGDMESFYPDEVGGRHRLAFCQGSGQFVIIPAQGQPSGHCYREPDPQRDPGLSVGCSCGSEQQGAGIPLPQGRAQRHLYPQPGHRLEQKPDLHPVCQILGPGKGQLDPSPFFKCLRASVMLIRLL